MAEGDPPAAAEPADEELVDDEAEEAGLSEYEEVFMADAGEEGEALLEVDEDIDAVQAALPVAVQVHP